MLKSHYTNTCTPPPLLLEEIVFLQAVLPRNKLMSSKRVAIDFGGLIALWLLSGCKQVPESWGTEAGINDLIFKSSGLP